MICRILACDFDGTGATDGHLAPEVAAALAAARSHGYLTLLATGRVREDLDAMEIDMSIFDAVVAENGAVVWFPNRDRTIQLGAPPPDRFLGELRSRGIPFHVGAVVVGTWTQHAPELLRLIQELAIDGQITFNRGAVMVLPSGVNKASGVRRALAELGYSERNLVAFGDAENDLPLFSTAELGVTVGNALPAVAAQADLQLSGRPTVAVADFIHRLLSANGELPTRRRRIVLGHEPSGAPVSLPPSGRSVVVAGDPRSGKSWIAGLMAEQLVEQGYRVCIIDPEGDYAALAERPRFLRFGADLALPPAQSVGRLLREEALSLVFDLATLGQQDQGNYVRALLAEIATLRTERGFPHWVVVDEAHYFFREREGPALRPDDDGDFIFVTYRPSLLADAVYSRTGALVVTRTEVEDERYFLSSLLHSRGPANIDTAGALGSLDAPQAVGLLAWGEETPRWQVFRPGERLTVHTHHARKYSDVQLPEGKTFNFLRTGGAEVVAHNVAEFYGAVERVPAESLRHHMFAGDFSKWIGAVLGDVVLARRLAKLERTVRNGAPPERAEILAHVKDRYLLE